LIGDGRAQQTAGGLTAASSPHPWSPFSPLPSLSHPAGTTPWYAAGMEG
jgi:hypothetical protein